MMACLHIENGNIMKHWIAIGASAVMATALSLAGNFLKLNQLLEVLSERFYNV
jgi:hypothetical protein